MLCFREIATDTLCIEIVIIQVVQLEVPLRVVTPMLYSTGHKLIVGYEGQSYESSYGSKD